MSERPFRIELLGQQDRSSFDCGVTQLNEYFHRRASQDVKRHCATCFVAIDKRNDRIAGYYTLCMSSVLLDDLPEKIAKKLPRYPQVPVVRLGRLAIDGNYQGQKLGGSLLADAIVRTGQSEYLSILQNR